VCINGEYRLRQLGKCGGKTLGRKPVNRVQLDIMVADRIGIPQPTVNTSARTDLDVGAIGGVSKNCAAFTFARSSPRWSQSDGAQEGFDHK
jgi:hypothetical protein